MTDRKVTIRELAEEAIMIARLRSTARVQSNGGHNDVAAETEGRAELALTLLDTLVDSYLRERGIPTWLPECGTGD